MADDNEEIEDDVYDERDVCCDVISGLEKRVDFDIRLLYRLLLDFRLKVNALRTPFIRCP